MANKRKQNTGKRAIVNKFNFEPSTKNEDSSFVEEKSVKDVLESKESKELFEEIQTVMEEGSYRKTKKVSSTTDSDEGTEAQVFKAETLSYSLQSKELKPKKVKKAKKTYEHTTFAHKMKVLGVLLVLGVFAGSGLGVWYFNYELRSNFNPNAYNIADYIQSIDETFARNNINAKEKGGLAWIQTAQAQGLTPADLTPVDNFVLAEFNTTKANSYEINGTGYVLSMKVKQSIVSRKKYNGSYYTFESISPSAISLLDDIILCDKYNTKTGKVDLYSSNKIKPEKDDWKFSKTITSSEYEILSGGLPNTIQAYIISDKTVKETSNTKESVVYNEEDKTYSFTMQLDTKTSVLNYAKQMKRTGGLGGYPVFNTIKFSVVIDSDWNLISFSIKEDYYAIKGIKAYCSGELNYTVTINGDVDMPV